MSISGYDKETFDAYEDLIELREYCKEKLIKYVKLLENGFLSYDETLERIKFDEKSIKLATWKYKQLIEKCGKSNLFD